MARFLLLLVVTCALGGCASWGTPQPPAPTGNVRADSAARVEYERNLTRYFEQRQGGGFQQRTELRDANAQPTGIQPNADDLAAIEATHKDLYKRFPNNNQAREILERARMDVFAGKRLDREALSTAFSQAVETRDDRELRAAVEQLSAVIDKDGAVQHDKIPRALMHGYSLPPGQYDAEETVGLLRLAKELGITQDQVDKYVAMQADE